MTEHVTQSVCEKSPVGRGERCLGYVLAKIIGRKQHTAPSLAKARAYPAFKISAIRASCATAAGCNVHGSLQLQQKRLLTSFPHAQLRLNELSRLNGMSGFRGQRISHLGSINHNDTTLTEDAEYILLLLIRHMVLLQQARMVDFGEATIFSCVIGNHVFTRIQCYDCDISTKSGTVIIVIYVFPLKGLNQC